MSRQTMAARSPLHPKSTNCKPTKSACKQFRNRAAPFFSLPDWVWWQGVADVNPQLNRPVMLKPALLFFALILGSPAAQVFFSSEIFRTNLDSEGNALNDDWVFALGAFEEGFVPTPANREIWASKWTTARATAYEGDLGFFSGEFQFFTNEAPFLTTNTGYLWGYNCSGEWILMTGSNWNWPNTGDPLAIPSNWNINNATEVIVGAVNTDDVHIRTESGGEGFDVPPFTYADWRASYFDPEEHPDLSISGFNADPDGDGHPNLVEYAQGTNPRKSTKVDPGKVIFVERNGMIYPALEFKVSRKTQDVTVVLGSTTDLNDWTGASNITLPFESADPEKKVFRSVIPITGVSRRFFRIVAIPEIDID